MTIGKEARSVVFVIQDIIGFDDIYYANRIED